MAYQIVVFQSPIWPPGSQKAPALRPWPGTPSSFYGGWLLTQSPLSDCASLFTHGPYRVSVRPADQSARVEMTNSANFPFFLRVTELVNRLQMAGQHFHYTFWLCYFQPTQGSCCRPATGEWRLQLGTADNFSWCVRLTSCSCEELDLYRSGKLNWVKQRVKKWGRKLVQTLFKLYNKAHLVLIKNDGTIPFWQTFVFYCSTAIIKISAAFLHPEIIQEKTSELIRIFWGVDVEKQVKREFVSGKFHLKKSFKFQIKITIHLP